MPPSIQQYLRYIAAVLLSPIIGEVVGIPYAFVLDALWGHTVTGGQWEISIPNLILDVIRALATGYSAGLIAGKHGKIVAALANFCPLIAFTAMLVAFNRDLLWVLRLDSPYSFWVWVGLIPSIVAGHFAVRFKPRRLGPLRSAAKSETTQRSPDAPDAVQYAKKMDVGPNTYRQRVLTHLQRHRPNEASRLAAQGTLTVRVDDLSTQVADWVNSQLQGQEERLSNMDFEARVRAQTSEQIMFESDAIRETLPMDEATQREIGPSGAYED